MKEFYENLKNRREERGISIEEIHRRSRLPVKYLQAIEDGQMESLPPGYERIYLRRYARELGLDEEEVIHDYDLLSGRLTPATAAREAANESRAEPEPDRSPEPRQRVYREPSFWENWNWDRIHKIFWISLATVVVLGGAYFTFQQYVLEQNQNDLNIREITLSELMEQTGQANTAAAVPAEAAKPDPPATSPSAAPRVSVTLLCIDSTWVREVRDQTDTTEYILTPGLRRTSRAVNRISMLLGRADGVQVWVNRDSLGILGARDQVAMLTATPAGVVQQRLRKITRAPGRTRATDQNTVLQPDSLP